MQFQKKFHLTSSDEIDVTLTNYPVIIFTLIFNYNNGKTGCEWRLKQPNKMFYSELFVLGILTDKLFMHAPYRFFFESSKGESKTLPFLSR